MAAGKTGALLACAGCDRRGAARARDERHRVAVWPRSGFSSGMAFQAVDDLLGIWGAAGADRQAGLDRPAAAQEVAAGRRCARPCSATRPIALARAPVAEPDLTEAEIAEAAELVEPCGRPALAAEEADAAARAGRCASSSARPSIPTAREELDGARPLHRREGAAERRTASDATSPCRRARPRRRRTCSRSGPSGWWKGELETNVTMDAEDLLLREFLGIRTDEQTRARGALDPLAAARRRHVGATSTAAPADLSTTVEAYVALRLAGDPADAAHMRARPRVRPRRRAASSATRVFTRIWLALFGAVVVGRPAGAAAGADLPAAVVPAQHLRLRLLGPADGRAADRRRRAAGRCGRCRSTLDELRVGRGRRSRARPSRPGQGVPSGSTACCTRYERAPGRGRCARARAAPRRATGSSTGRRPTARWGGIQPPWVYSLIALHLLGYALDHPVMRAALAGLDGFTIVERRPRPCAGSRRASRRSGTPPGADRAAPTPGCRADAPGAACARRDWLLGEEIRVRGDWAVRRPDLAPGGWAFEFANDSYPDIDDTAEVVLALRRVGTGRRAGRRGRPRRRAGRSACSRATAAGARSTPTTPASSADELPFCDFGEVIDPP